MFVHSGEHLMSCIDERGNCPTEKLLTTIEITLPDELILRARRAGLLDESAVQGLLEEALRRQAGRALLIEAKRLRSAALPPMSDDALVGHVHEVRAQLRDNRADRS